MSAPSDVHLPPTADDLEFHCTGEHEVLAPWSFENHRGDRITVRLEEDRPSYDLGVRVHLETPRHVVVAMSYDAFTRRIRDLVDSRGGDASDPETQHFVTSHFWEITFDRAIPVLFPASPATTAT